MILQQSHSQREAAYVESRIQITRWDSMEKTGVSQPSLTHVPLGASNDILGNQKARRVCRWPTRGFSWVIKVLHHLKSKLLL